MNPNRLSNDEFPTGRSTSELGKCPQAGPPTLLSEYLLAGNGNAQRHAGVLRGDAPDGSPCTCPPAGGGNSGGGPSSPPSREPGSCLTTPTEESKWNARTEIPHRSSRTHARCVRGVARVWCPRESFLRLAAATAATKTHSVAPKTRLKIRAGIPTNAGEPGRTNT
jgi:hypothetical protein